MPISFVRTIWHSLIHSKRSWEYTEEVEDAHEESPLEEAIEYCNSEQMGAWQGTDGACEWVRSVILKVLKGQSVSGGVLSLSDINCWKDKLDQIKEEYAAFMEEQKLANCVDEEISDGGSDEEGEEDDDEMVVDVNMFAGMFETAMEMLQEAGELSVHS